MDELKAQDIRNLVALMLVRPLAETAWDRLAAYIRLLTRWNARINLTAVRDPRTLAALHIAKASTLCSTSAPVPVYPASRSKSPVQSCGSRSPNRRRRRPPSCRKLCVNWDFPTHPCTRVALRISLLLNPSIWLRCGRWIEWIKLFELLNDEWTRLDSAWC
jgi:hypothetical protein